MPNPYKLYKYTNMVIFNVLAFMAFASHLKSMLSDPGAVPRGNATKENIQQMGFREGEIIFKCPKCSSIKPSRAHHCSVCKRCILKMGTSWLILFSEIFHNLSFLSFQDHHCPWVRNPQVKNYLEKHIRF